MGQEAEGSARLSDTSNGVDHTQNDDRNRQLDIYPLSCYYFGSKEAIPFKNETPADRVQRLNSIYAAYGLRTCVEAVILVELFKHPHMLLLQECIKLFLVKLPESHKFIVAKNLKLLAVPLCQTNKNLETYGPIISGVPELLSNYTFSIRSLRSY